MTRLESAPPLTRCRTWIQGRDLRELAIAAAQELDTDPSCCGFTVIAPENAARRTFLEVCDRDAEALVGPMAGPRVPSNVSTSPDYFLDELIECLSLNEDTPACGPGTSLRSIITVRYASIWDEGVYPPPRADRESDASYRDRCAAAERFLIDRASKQGFFALEYAVPVCDWAASDLASIIELAYERLPLSEPATRESGWISWNPCEQVPGRCVAHVARGDYVASLRLPTFPTAALADWLTRGRCAIDLYHPLATRLHGTSATSAAALWCPVPCHPTRETA